MRYLIFLAASLLGLSAFPQSNPTPQLSLSPLFSDQMVLQQKQRVNIWGKASAGQMVNIVAGWGRNVSTTTDANGNWKAKLATPQAGGPYTIQIKTANSKISLNDVLIGEVWLASGQSNMDIPLKGWPPGDTIFNSKQEINNAKYPDIRFFKVPFGIAVSPSDSIGGKWLGTSPQTAGDFSATAYFYARKLQHKLKVPIGIIQSSIGGTPAEAWTSKESLKKLGDFDRTIDGLAGAQSATESWFKKWPVQGVPKTNDQWKSISFGDESAATVGFDDTGWTAIKLPGRVDRVKSVEFDGAVWLRKEFFVDDITTTYTLKIDAVDDMDWVFINGSYVGGLVGNGAANAARVITIPAQLLKKGSNIVAIRVIDTGGPGSVTGAMYFVNNRGDSISVQGNWKFRLVAELLNNKFYTYGLQAKVSERPQLDKINSNNPTVLFNAMISPLLPFTVKGVIWYQGESNVGRAEQYKRLFPAMIADWRGKWGHRLPFYFVQLAPYLYSATDQKEQSQKLRDAQRYALALPQTGMVTTLDIGYLKTAHPPFKQQVGDRLANFALKYEYGEKSLVASGPLYKSVEAEDGKLIIKFESVGTGLLASPSGLNNFEIAGADKVFVKADATIVGNKVVVSSSIITAPVYVRYAWSDGSSASLFNKEGLPAATFTSE
ncbi:sialate O-acetylesterase [Mucilaginibacter sp.]|uniref:sialate O-acetylesterase n=1 Tax=Mucilaginibacter sp. TaxID=1882438 RepID=UPI0032630F92